MRNVVLDTGPLVAFIDRRDRYHPWAVAQWNQIEVPLLTCESVISEAVFLLRGVPHGTRGVLDALERSGVSMPFRLQEELKAVARLMTRYRDIPMSLADACLVRMTELESRSIVLTLDDDFRVYRRNRRQPVPTITPNA